jgi:hypothetical protein
VPDALRQGDPVVLLLHGFTGSRDELPIGGSNEGVFSRTARLLAEKGFASLRIDFLGSGQSTDRPWEATTFSGQIDDAVRSVVYLKERFPDHPIALLGWSQGGLVAAHVAAQRPELAGVVLWAPVAQPRSTYSTLLGSALVEEAIASEGTSVYKAILPWGAETRLNTGFFRELATTDPVAAIARYPGPLLVIAGTKDAVVAPQPQSGELFLRYRSGQSELTTLATDHAFGALEGTAMLDQVIGTTVDWLQRIRAKR